MRTSSASRWRHYFYPRSPRGERPVFMFGVDALDNISIHAPREGSDRRGCADHTGVRISIHAPREGSDRLASAAYETAAIFLSTLPARGATRRLGGLPAMAAPFLSTLPARGATGRDRIPGKLALISIHAPREGSDLCALLTVPARHLFLSTLPARGATDVLCSLKAGRSISIHAPREGSDQ